MIYEHSSDKKFDKNIEKKKHSNISLNGLLKWYLDIDNKIKEDVRLLMQKDIYFWLKVSNKILKYIIETFRRKNDQIRGK
jgi:hypothetical protein